MPTPISITTDPGASSAFLSRIAREIPAIGISPMSCLLEAKASVTAALETGKPVWLSWSIADTGEAVLRSGESIHDAWHDIANTGVQAVLINCSPPEAISKVLPELISVCDIPVGAYANAFTPIPHHWDFHGNESIPPARVDVTPAVYADHARDWVDAGAVIVGGCCEVGPDHIERLQQMLR